MPIIAVEITEKLYDELRDLVVERQYHDLSQLVDVALRNQLALEERFLTEGRKPLNLGNFGNRPKKVGTLTKIQKSGAREIEARGSRSPKTPPSSSSPDRQWIEIIENFRFKSGDEKGPPLCDAQVRPGDEQMYALVNRLFPIKLAARWLDVHATRTSRWPLLSDAVKLLSEHSAIVGSLLVENDAVMRRSRDDHFATALPRLDKPDSLDRFAAQFIGRVTQTNGVYPGAIVQFALADTKNSQLILTNKGAELSRLSNPVIDGNGERFQTLSEEETAFFLNQIQAFMPREAADFKLVLKAVSMGHNTPNDLVGHLEGKFRGRETPAAFRSHISGVISRLVETDLLRRTWKGRYVSYGLSDNAPLFILS